MFMFYSDFKKISQASLAYRIIFAFLLLNI